MAVISVYQLPTNYSVTVTTVETQLIKQPYQTKFVFMLLK